MAAVAGLVAAASATALSADDMVLRAEAELVDTGLIGHLVPRFSLKTGVRITVESGSPDLAGADAVVGSEAALAALGRVRPAFHAEGGPTYALLLVPEAAGAEAAARFADWLFSDIGQRTVAQFAPESGPVYRPGRPEVATVAAPVLSDGNAEDGERLAHLHCGRCHVVSERNRMGGIGSTPSFAALKALGGWEDRFLTFWALNPHPSFTQVEGLTAPFDPLRPPHIAPVEMTEGDLEAILAYVAGIEAKDLGAAIGAQ